jgi:hypothetical protein
LLQGYQRGKNTKEKSAAIKKAKIKEIDLIFRGLRVLLTVFPEGVGF